MWWGSEENGAEALAAGGWLAATGGLLWSSNRLSRWFFPQERWDARLLQILLFSWAQIVLLTVGLGLGGQLYPVGLLAGALALAGVCYWLTSSLPGCSPEELAEEDSRSRWGERLRQGIWALALAFLLARVIEGGFLRFPSDWDTLTYHLPLVVQWLQRHSLYAPDEGNWANPGNNELIGLWCVAPFSGDFLISLNNLPAIIMLALALEELGRQLKLHPGWRLVCALAVLVTQPVINQAVTAGNDVAAAACWVTTLSYQLRYFDRGRRQDLFISSIALGILAGIKYYAPGYAAIALGSLVVLTAVIRGRRTAVEAAAVALLGLFLWGSYWYLRNLLHTGTPLYPKGFTPSTDLMSQIRPDQWWQTNLLGHARLETWYLLQHVFWRFCGPLPWLGLWLLPLLWLWLLCSAIGIWWRSGQVLWPWLALGFWLPAASLIWGLTPFSVTATPGTLDMLLAGFSPSRYGMCFLSLLVFALGMFLYDLSLGTIQILCWLFSCRPVAALTSRWPRCVVAGKHCLAAWFSSLLLMLLAAAVLYQLAAGLVESYWLREINVRRMGILTVDILFLGGVLVGCWQFLPRWRLGILALLGLGFILSCVALSQRWHREFASAYDQQFADRFLIHELPALDPAEERICVLAHRYYPFFGSRRQFRASRPLWLPSYEAFLKYLAGKQITLVVAVAFYPVPQFYRYSRPVSWLRDHPEIFLVKSEGVHWRSYRVQRGELLRALAAMP